MAKLCSPATLVVTLLVVAMAVLCFIRHSRGQRRPQRWRPDQQSASPHWSGGGRGVEPYQQPEHHVGVVIGRWDVGPLLWWGKPAGWEPRGFLPALCHAVNKDEWVGRANKS
ncbi:unnamed protein product [Linum trigynum]|uniref:Secreted protein n=1 Tax=Linum trigynum TaxID=586398 RepID=A0AAV2EKN7_9ROSI